MHVNVCLYAWMGSLHQHRHYNLERQNKKILIGG